MVIERIVGGLTRKVEIELTPRKLRLAYEEHGIPFRRVCLDCYDRIMSDCGFDGEEYTAADECLNYDY